MLSVKYHVLSHSVAIVSVDYLYHEVNFCLFPDIQRSKQIVGQIVITIILRYRAIHI
jgi:hypothetical protein